MAAVRESQSASPDLRLGYRLLYPAASVRDFGGAPSDRICGIGGEENRHDSGPPALAHDVLLVLKPFAALF